MQRLTALCLVAFPLQYSYLLTSQLESQRIYWENKIVRIEKDTAEEASSLRGSREEGRLVN